MRDIIFCAPLMVMIMHKAWHKFKNEFYTLKSDAAHVLNIYLLTNNYFLNVGLTHWGIYYYVTIKVLKIIEKVSNIIFF